MSQGPDILPQPPPRKSPVVFTTWWRMTDVSQTDNSVGISQERVENILHNELGVSKVSARWVPQLLTAEAHQAGHHVASEFDTFWSKISSQFSWTFPHARWVLGPPLQARDQTTIHAVDPEHTPLLPLQRRPSWRHWQGRWRLPSSGMQRALCSLTTFRKAKLSMAWKTDEVPFHQDNAPTHKSVVAMAAVHRQNRPKICAPPQKKVINYK